MDEPLFCGLTKLQVRAKYRELLRSEVGIEYAYRCNDLLKQLETPISSDERKKVLLLIREEALKLLDTLGANAYKSIGLLYELQRFRVPRN